MGANEKLGLPRDKMRKIKIAFDVDGTLRCNCTDTCTQPNEDILMLFNILSKMKNTDMYIWSGGGGNYAYSIAKRFGIKISVMKCISKIGARVKPDIAIDDIQDTALGGINLIVREK